MQWEGEAQTLEPTHQFLQFGFRELLRSGSIHQQLVQTSKKNLIRELRAIPFRNVGNYCWFINILMESHHQGPGIRHFRKSVKSHLR